MWRSTGPGVRVWLGIVAPVASDEEQDGSGGNAESKGTVLVAGAANLFIAVAKLVGGLVSGSSAMLAEAAHSVADTMNQVFLLTALRKGDKSADEEHPFGYGKERFFWSLLAAVGIFVAGGLFSIFEGVEGIRHPEHGGGFLIPYAVLGVAFVAEGVSWLKAVRQTKKEAGDSGHGVVEHIKTDPDPTVKTVAFEDSAALVGLVIAAVGIGLKQLTGQAFWDGSASVLIGLLLIVVAFWLGRQNKDLLIGQAVAPELRRGIVEELESIDGVDGVLELLTMYVGPDTILVAAQVDLGGSLSGEAIERLSDEADRRVCEQFPKVRHLFLDPTARRPAATGPVGRSPGVH